MNILTKYDLKDFYCGFITINKLAATGKEAKMVSSFHNINSKYIDITNDRYDNNKTMFSLFLKIDENKFYCLLDDKTYDISELLNNKSNLGKIVPFVDYFPQYHANIKTKVSIREALDYFKMFYKPNYMSNLLSDDKLSSKKLRVGYINVSPSKEKNIKDNISEKEYSIYYPDSLILLKNGADLNQCFSKYDKDSGWEHYYYSLKALFLLEEYGVFCLNNGKVYTKGTIDEQLYTPSEIGKPYYDFLTTLKSTENTDTISLKTAVKRFRHKEKC